MNKTPPPKYRPSECENKDIKFPVPGVSVNGRIVAYPAGYMACPSCEMAYYKDKEGDMLMYIHS